MILVIVLVVAGVAYKTLAGSVSRKLGVATTSTGGEGAGGPAGTGGAGGTSCTTGGSGGAHGDGYSAYDGTGKPTGAGGSATTSDESSSMLARFGLVCVAVLGGAAAIFAIMKGKHAT